MLPRKWEHRVQDILDAIAEIQAFVGPINFDQFRSDAKTIRAVGADLMIIGEAASYIPEDVREASPDIPWHLMRAMRNRIVHAYFDIDTNIVWDIIHTDLPQIVEPLRRLLPNGIERCAHATHCAGSFPGEGFLPARASSPSPIPGRALLALSCGSGERAAAP